MDPGEYMTEQARDIAKKVSMLVNGDFLNIQALLSSIPANFPLTDNLEHLYVACWLLDLRVPVLKPYAMFAYGNFQN